MNLYLVYAAGPPLAYCAIAAECPICARGVAMDSWECCNPAGWTVALLDSCIDRPEGVIGGREGDAGWEFLARRYVDGLLEKERPEKTDGR